MDKSSTILNMEKVVIWLSIGAIVWLVTLWVYIGVYVSKVETIDDRQKNMETSINTVVSDIWSIKVSIARLETLLQEKKGSAY